MKRLVNISEYMVTFHVDQFMRAFLYHIIFFFFGVLVVPIICVFETPSLARNMMFWGYEKGFLRQNVTTQYFFWMCSAVCIALFLIKQSGKEIYPGFKIELYAIY